MTDHTTHQSAEAVRAFLGGLQLIDVDAAMTAVAPDVDLVIHPLRVTENGAAGRERLRSLLEEIVTAFPDLLITVAHLTDLGAVVVAEFKLEGTQAATFMGAINQEKHLDLDVAWRFTVTDGLVTGVDAYWCMNQLYRRLAVKQQNNAAIV